MGVIWDDGGQEPHQEGAGAECEAVVADDDGDVQRVQLARKGEAADDLRGDHAAADARHGAERSPAKEDPHEDPRRTGDSCMHASISALPHNL